jgi:hypothetical protein
MSGGSWKEDLFTGDPALIDAVQAQFNEQRGLAAN